jgi:hypothetical protein
VVEAGAPQTLDGVIVVEQTREAFQRTGSAVVGYDGSSLPAEDVLTLLRAAGRTRVLGQVALEGSIEGEVRDL